MILYQGWLWGYYIRVDCDDTISRLIVMIIYQGWLWGYYIRVDCDDNISGLIVMIIYQGWLWWYYIYKWFCFSFFLLYSIFRSILFVFIHVAYYQGWEFAHLLIAQIKWATVSDSLRSLRGNERCEQIAHFAQDKWATMSDSLRSLRGNEQMSDSLKNVG